MGLDRDSYYAIRATVPIDDARRAARLIYLTSHAFNGIYRVNRQGQFNVPYGGRRYEGLGTEGRLRPYSEALQGIEMKSGDFEAALDSALAGDVVYLDPPYTVRHSNNGFVKYNDRIFLWRDQERLAETARDLCDRGCTVIVSNAHHASIEALYPDFNKIVVSRPSVMASDSSFRGPIAELILANVG
jgi:DNA adenine methylase